MFRLDGIPAAPRGVPQIEVTFDIDANGIVHVTAKDLGTGKEQNVTITASTNMSKDDIDKAVKEAEQFAEEDKKRREEIDVRNAADQMVYQSEKALTDLGDKVSADEKSRVQQKIDALKEALKGTNVDDIKQKQEDLQKDFYEMSSKMYQQAQQSAGPEAGAQQDDGGASAGGGDYVDADYREVDEDDKK